MKFNPGGLFYIVDMGFLEVIESNKSKFLNFNNNKYQRFQDLLQNTNIRRVVNAIPYFLCVNNKKLPGYVEGDVPLGIVNYQPDEETRRYLKGKFPAVSLELNNSGEFIEMLAVMGSVGTVAYNKKSDFDYWVCVNRHDVTALMFENFLKKIDSLQKWATLEMDVPVHLFVNDIENIKQNIFAEDEEEAFGSTIGAVLKDEFFRTSIIIAGKIPFWWVLPHFVKDEEYEKFFGLLPDELKRRDYVDLGNLYEISRDDFMGSALFQIIKSLGNPFKSIIKIGVLEKYLFGEQDYLLLSQKLKMNILRGTLDNTLMDSYLMMFREVYDYYNSTMEDKNLLNILKQNLYLKIDPQITRYIGVKDRKNIPYKVAVMSGYVKDWGWDINILRDLDNFDNWDFGKVMIFWESVKRFMLLSYQRISAQLPALNLQKKISESDFLLLSRKIKTHFRQEKDKIDHLITFKDTPYEQVLYIEPINQGITETEWRLNKRDRSEQDAFQSTTIRSEKSLIKLLTWMALNRIYDPTFTRLNLQSGYSRINQTLVTELLNTIYNFFTSDRIKTTNEYYLNSDFKLLNLIIINFNMEGAETVKTVHHLYMTSWGEAFLKEYSSEGDLAHILSDILKDGMKLKRSFEDYCCIVTPESYKKHYKKIITIFRDAYAWIIEKKDQRTVRLITRLGNNFIKVTREKDKVTSNVYANLINLLTASTLKPKRSIEYRFVSYEDHLASIEEVYSNARNNAITIIFEEKGDVAIFYVRNESGNFFVFFKPKKLMDQFLIFLYGVCKGIIQKVNTGTGRTLMGENSLQVMRLQSDKFGKVSFQLCTGLIEEEYLTKYSSSTTLTVTVAKHMGDDVFYDVRFPDGTSSGFMTINEAYSVSERIRSHQERGQELYNIVRELNFSDLQEQDWELGSTVFFLEKFKLEYMVDKCLKK